MAHDCTEGCDGSHTHKWEIEPHPHTSDFDVMVTDSDDEAREAFLHPAEIAWDSCQPGEKKTITITHNAR